MLKIAINLTEIDPNYRGGINTYTHGLINGFLNLRSKDVYFNLICVENNHLEFQKYVDHNILITKLPNRNIIFKIIKNLLFWINNKYLFEKFSNFYWKDAQKISKDCNITYWPTTVLNFFNSKNKTIVSMHDIQHIHYPNFFSLKEKLVRKLYFSLTVKYVNHIQASSFFIKRDLLNNFKSLDEKQINVINEGVSVNDFTFFKNITDIKKKYSIPKNYIFYPAQLWPHKNHTTIIKAMGYLLKNKNIKIYLVLTGKNYGFYKNICPDFNFY